METMTQEELKANILTMLDVLPLDVAEMLVYQWLWNANLIDSEEIKHG